MTTMHYRSGFERRMVSVVGVSWAVADAFVRLLWLVVFRLAKFAVLLVPTLAVAPAALFLAVMFGSEKRSDKPERRASDIAVLDALAFEEMQRIQNGRAR